MFIIDRSVAAPSCAMFIIDRSVAAPSCAMFIMDRSVAAPSCTMFIIDRSVAAPSCTMFITDRSIAAPNYEKQDKRFGYFIYPFFEIPSSVQFIVTSPTKKTDTQPNSLHKNTPI